MLGDVIGFLMGLFGTDAESTLGKIGHKEELERESDFIWSSVMNESGFWYNLRSDTWDGEEWCYVHLPGTEPDDIEPGDLSWEEFLAIEPSYKRLDAWYKANHRQADEEDMTEIGDDDLEPEPPVYDYKTGYTFLRWNGEYGEESKFVVRDNSTGEQSMFTPGRTRDLVWTQLDLANANPMNTWSEFGDETVDDLGPIAF